jgi:hypothetical protein
VADLSFDDDGQPDRLRVGISAPLGFGQRTVEVSHGAYILLRGRVILELSADDLRALPEVGGHFSSFIHAMGWTSSVDELEQRSRGRRPHVSDPVVIICATGLPNQAMPGIRLESGRYRQRLGWPERSVGQSRRWWQDRLGSGGR